MRASGITAVRGDVVVDDRLFTPYRVPNGNLLITPVLVNVNLVDVTVAPTRVGRPATLDYRPRSAAFAVTGAVGTAAAGTTTSVSLSGEGRVQCVGRQDCTGEVTGTLPQDYAAPLTGGGSFVGTFRIEDPASYARTAFIEALEANGVSVRAAAVAKNPAGLLPTRRRYPDRTRVASLPSAPYAQHARLILKVSLNLGRTSASACLASPRAAGRSRAHSPPSAPP